MFDCEYVMDLSPDIINLLKDWRLLNVVDIFHHEPLFLLTNLPLTIVSTNSLNHVIFL